MTILVCNTGPLIALAKIQKINLLNELGLENIFVPYRVYKELLGKIGSESCFIESALDNFIQVKRYNKVGDEIEKIVSHIDAGEQEVILLGSVISNEVLLFLDDKAGRSVAKRLNFIGTAGMCYSLNSMV